MLAVALRIIHGEYIQLLRCWKSNPTGLKVWYTSTAVLSIEELYWNLLLEYCLLTPADRGPSELLAVVLSVC